MSSPFDELVASADASGALDTVPLAGEMPAQTQSRADTTQRVRTKLKAADLSSRGVAWAMGPSGPQEVTDPDTGTSLTSFSRASGIGYNSNGQARKVSYSDPTAPPEVSDPYVDAPTKTDKAGNTYAAPKGLPWQQTGTDAAVQEATATKRRASLDAEANAALSPEYTAARTNLLVAQKQAKQSSKATASQLQALGVPTSNELGQPAVDLDNDPAAARNHIEDTFNKEYASPAANASPLFGGARYTSDATVLRKDIDDRKAAALEVLNNHVNTVAQVQQSRGVFDQLRQQRQSLQGNKLAAVNAKREVAGLAPVGIPGIDQFSAATEPAPTPVATATGPVTAEQPVDDWADEPGGKPVSGQDQPAAVPFNTTEQPFRADEAGNVTFDPARLTAGITAAAQAGHIDAEKAAKLLPLAQAAEKAYADQAKLLANDTVASKLKALGIGATKGAAFLAGAPAGAALGAEAGSAIAPGPGTVVGGALGGLITGSVAAYGAGKIIKKLGEFSKTIQDFQDAADAHPYYDAAGNLVAFGAGIPKAAFQAAGAAIGGTGRVASVGTRIAEEAAAAKAAGTAATLDRGKAISEIATPANLRNALAQGYENAGGGVASTIGNLTEEARRRALGGASPAEVAKIVAARVGGNAAGMLLIDTAIKEGSKALGITDEGQTLPGAAQAALLGAFFAGHGIKFQDTTGEEMANILTRARARTNAGVTLDAQLRPDQMPPNVDLHSAEMLSKPLTPREMVLASEFNDQVKQMVNQGKIKAPAGADDLADLARASTGKEVLQGGIRQATGVEIKPGEVSPTGEAQTPAGGPLLQAPTAEAQPQGIPGIEPVPQPDEPAPLEPATQQPSSPQSFGEKATIPSSSVLARPQPANRQDETTAPAPPFDTSALPEGAQHVSDAQALEFYKGDRQRTDAMMDQSGYRREGEQWIKAPSQGADIQPKTPAPSQPGNTSEGASESQVETASEASPAPLKSSHTSAASSSADVAPEIELAARTKELAAMSERDPFRPLVANRIEQLKAIMAQEQEIAAANAERATNPPTDPAATDSTAASQSPATTPTAPSSVPGIETLQPSTSEAPNVAPSAPSGIPGASELPAATSGNASAGVQPAPESTRKPPAAGASQKSGAAKASSAASDAVSAPSGVPGVDNLASASKETEPYPDISQTQPEPASDSTRSPSASDSSQPEIPSSSTKEAPVAAKGQGSESRGVAMLDIEGSSRKRILDVGKTIDPADLYHGEQGTDSYGPEYGLETDPHITALYGFTDKDPAPVQRIMEKFGPVKARLGKVSLFENEGSPYDVVKVDVEGNDLQRLNAELRKLPHKSDFPDYHPHVTIAYVKKGEGEKYVGKQSFTGTEITFNNATFSDANRSKTKIKLSNEPTQTPKENPAPSPGTPDASGANEVAGGRKAVDGGRTDQATTPHSLTDVSKPLRLWARTSLKPQFDMLQTDLVERGEGYSHLSSAVEGDRMVVQFNPRQVADSMDLIRRNWMLRGEDAAASGKRAKAWLKSALGEELIHQRQQVFERGGPDFRKTYESIWRALPKPTRDLATTVIGYTGPDWQMGAEYERMLIQHREGDAVTESLFAEKARDEALAKLKPLLEAEQAPASEDNAVRVQTLAADVMPGLGEVMEASGDKLTASHPSTDYTAIADRIWEHPTDTLERPMMNEATLRIEYAKLTKKTGFPAVPIADLLEGAGYLPGGDTMARSKGILAGMEKRDEARLGLGDWSLSSPREKAWAVVTHGGERNTMVELLPKASEIPGVNALRASEPKEEKNLVAVHNLTAEKLRNVLKIGGIPVPSMAVIRVDKSNFTGFGDITLVAPKNMVDPKSYSGTTKVFNADVYSPRYPSVETELTKIGAKSLAEFLKSAPAFADNYGTTIDGILNGIKDNGLSKEIESNSRFGRKFLQEKGKDVEPKDGERAYEYGNRIREEIRSAGLRDEFNDWAEKLPSREAWDVTERIRDGYTNSGNRKYLKHDLDTVVKILKRKLRDGEGFNYGVSSIRATMAKQFRTVEQIQKARGDIIHTDDMQKLKDEVNSEFQKLAEDSLPMRANGRDGFGALDHFSDDMKALAEGGVSNIRHLNEMYPDAKPFGKMREFLQKLQTMPTEYFEAKIQRPVSLSEFEGAVVPDGTPDDIIAALKKRGISIVKYPKGDEAARKAAVEQVANERNALFASKPNPLVASIKSRLSNGTLTPQELDDLGPVLKRDLRDLYRGVSDKLVDNEKTKPLGLAMKRELDREQEILGQTQIAIDRQEKRLGRKGFAKAALEVKDYRKTQDSDPAAAAVMLPKLSTEAQKLVATQNEVYDRVATLSEKIGLQVQQEDGTWRKFKRRTDYVPRMRDRELMNAIANPSGNPKAWRKSVEIYKLWSLDNERANSGVVPVKGEHGLMYINGVPVLKNNADVVNYTKATLGPVAPLAGTARNSNLLHSRTAPQPNRLYDYSFDAFERYRTAAAKTLAQVDAYGQTTGEDKLDLFDKTIQSSGDAATREYLGRVRDVAYGVTPQDTTTRMMAFLGSIATGTQLTNPVTTIANLLGGGTDTAHMFGTATTLEALTTLLKDYAKHVDESKEKGIIMRNLRGLGHDSENYDSNLVDKTRELAGIALEYAGYNAVEEFNRSWSKVAGQIAIRKILKAIRSNPGSRAAKEGEAFIRKTGVDFDKIKAENGEGRETDRFLRKTTNESQGSYKLAQTPLFTNTPIGRFLLQYQKWGVQHTQFFVDRLVTPAKDYIKSGGKQGSMVPLLRYVLLTAIGGMGLIALKESLFGSANPSASFEEIEKTASEDQKRAFVLLAQKLWKAQMAVSATGILANYAQMATDVFDRSRMKNPLSPPSVSSIAGIGDTLLRLMEQKTLTLGDLDDFLRSQISAYRVGKAGAARLADATGTPILDNERSRQDLSWLNARTRRFADEVGIEASHTALGRVAKTSDSPAKTDLLNALRTGDDQSAKDALAKLLHGGDPAAKKRALESVRATVRASQPVKVGAASETRRELFTSWAAKRLPAEDLDRLHKIDSTYRDTAQRIGLFKPSSVTPKALNSAREKLGMN